jgi:hypothetical protein
MQDQIQGCLSQGLIKELFAAYLGDTAQQLYYQDMFFGGSKPLSEIKSPFLFSQFRLAISGITAAYRISTKVIYPKYNKRKK